MQYNIHMTVHRMGVQYGHISRLWALLYRVRGWCIHWKCAPLHQFTHNSINDAYFSRGLNFQAKIAIYIQAIFLKLISECVSPLECDSDRFQKMHPRWLHFQWMNCKLNAFQWMHDQWMSALQMSSRLSLNPEPMRNEYWPMSPAMFFSMLHMFLDTDIAVDCN